MSSGDWLQAQYSVLGAVLIEPDLVPRMIQQTRPSDFSGQCKTVYSAMRSVFLSGAPVDPISVAAALGPDYRQFLAELMEITPSSANLDSYISLCREQAKVSYAQDLGQRLRSVKSSEEIQKLLEEANGTMVDKPSLRITTMSDALKSFMERHSGQIRYLTWPIPVLDERLYAEPGDFILMGGYPSTGKSAWSIQCAMHWAQHYKVGFFSLETSSEKLFDRQMSAIANLSMDDIKRNNLKDRDWGHVASLTSKITSLKLELIPAAGMSPAEIRSVTMMRGYQIIIIDYVQLLSSNGANRTEQVTNISLALHRMAQDMRVTIIALSQLKRKSDDDAPESSDLRESGQLEQDADVIMMLKLKEKNRPDGNRELYITKNKEGTCPMVELAFDGKHQTFTKASQTGQVVSQMKATAKKAQIQRRQEANGQLAMTDMPGDTYVPF